jgi:hypothetical protein
LVTASDKHNVATIAAVAAIWAASINELFVPKAHFTIAAVASDYLDLYCINKHLVLIIQYYPVK